MKKQDVTTLQARLKSYSILAGSVLAAGTAHAQINYVDIVPDTVIGRNEAMLFNFDKVGKAEFKISNHFESSTSSGIQYIYNLLFLEPMDSNEFLGVQSLIVTSTSSTNMFVPTVMEMNDKIGPAESYWTDNSYGIFYANVKEGPMEIKAGKWLKKEDKYVGVRFTFSGSANWHYGWIRLSVPNDSTIIVKDFAFETYPGKAINAGQKVSSVNEQANLFNIFMKTGHLIIQNTKMTEAKMNMYNTMGQSVMEATLKNETNSYDLSGLSKGIYIVKVQNGQDITSKKIIIR